jgi:hypothetical protein
MRETKVSYENYIQKQINQNYHAMDFFCFHFSVLIYFLMTPNNDREEHKYLI